MKLETIEGTKGLGESQNLYNINIFELFNRENGRSSLIELKKLPSKFRNKVRAIIASSDSKSVELMNNLRKKCSPPEIFQIEKTLRANRKIIPELFPQNPQTKEDYLRLVALPLHTQADLLQRLAAEYSDKIKDAIKTIKEINTNIAKQDYSLAIESCAKLAKRQGYSHLLLRKIALIRALKGSTSPKIEEILNLAGAGSNNLITSSLINCYQEEQEILSLKRSIMNLPDRGNGNKFTRDITRLNFHPHAKNEEELSELILSNLQSSLIDALLVAKINKHILINNQHKNLQEIFRLLTSASPGINEIAKLYKSDEEYIFYKHSSAWLEDNEIISYRTLVDNFHDTPDSDYLCLDEDTFSRVSTWLNELELSSLATSYQMTKHPHQNLGMV